MKLIALIAVCGLVSAKIPTCTQIPKGGRRRYQTPRTIERGDNNPAAIEFLLDERSTLLNIFAAGKNAELETLVSTELATLSTFSHAVGDGLMGQVFKVTRQTIVQMVRAGESQVKKEYGHEMATLYRDNTQRITRALKDIVMSKTILDKLAADEPYKADLYEIVENSFSEGSKVQKVFLDNHFETFKPILKMMSETFAVMHEETTRQVTKVINDEKTKSDYRRLVNELPQVYQFFNDNIDYVELNNVDKDLEEAIAAEILTVIAEQTGNTQIQSMINRHSKFIKKLMMDRTMEQQKQKAVAKVTEKNAELKAAADNEEEFQRLLAEAKSNGEEITDAMRKSIWAQVIANEKDIQGEEIANQQKQGQKGSAMSRYEHIVGIMGLMPDELKETIAAMVQSSCPELDLLLVESWEMEKVINEQPVNFIDQLIQELHDVCDMFGLIDANKVTTMMIKGVEVDFYAADWAAGKKVTWPTTTTTTPEPTTTTTTTAEPTTVEPTTVEPITMPTEPTTVY